VQRFDTEKGTNDIWLVDLARGIPSRLTFDPASDTFPVWSPDGSRVVFSSQKEGLSNLYQKLSSGAGQDELLFKSDDLKLLNDWSPDGRYILYQTLGQVDFDLWVLPLFEERKPAPYLQTDFVERSGRFSPDGRWVAYVSTASGKAEVFVRSFPDQGGQWQISNGGGDQPRWRRDGRELFYISADGKLMATEVNGGSGTFEFGIPKPLFELRVNFVNASPYDVAADGQRFLVASLVEQDVTPPVTVVLNWAAGLKR
jgi:Tol biopolymer transport system component